MSGSDEEPADKGPVYSFEGFRLDAQRRLLWRASGELIPLAPKTFDTLLHLVERPGELLAKRDLLEAIWPHVVVEENNLNQCVSALRRALGERPGEHRFIVTDPGRGYRFVASVRTEVPADADRTAELAAIEADPAAALPQESETAEPLGRASPPSVMPPATRPWQPPRTAWFLSSRGGLAAVAALVLATVWYWQTRPDDATAAIDPPVTTPSEVRDALPNSVAVLPFEVIGSDPTEIADGLHIELIGTLTQVGLNVKARGAVLQYAGTPPSFADIAAEQQVESILVGTLQHANEQIRVSLNLVDPAGFNLWSSPRYLYQPVDVFKMQADIAANVAATLQVELSLADRQRIEHRPTTSVEAQIAYWRALGIAGGENSGRRNTALALLEEAIALDPDFAEAHAQLALLYARSLVDWFNDPAPSRTPDEIYRRVSEVVRRVELLNRSQAVAYTALGEVGTYSWRWTEAAAAFENAYRSNSRDRDVLLFYSQFNTFRGEFTRASELADQVRELDSTLLFPTWLAYTYAGDLEPAFEYLERQLVLDEQQLTARLNLGFLEARRGDRGAAERQFQFVEGLAAGSLSASAMAGLAYGYSRIGRRDKAQQLFDAIREHVDSDSAGDGTRALAYLAIDDPTRAISALESVIRKIENHEPDPAWFALMNIKHNLTGDPVLEAPPFKELRERIRGS